MGRAQGWEAGPSPGLCLSQPLTLTVAASGPLHLSPPQFFCLPHGRVGDPSKVHRGCSRPERHLGDRQPPVLGQPCGHVQPLFLLCSLPGNAARPAKLTAGPWLRTHLQWHAEMADGRSQGEAQPPQLSQGLPDKAGAGWEGRAGPGGLGKPLRVPGCPPPTSPSRPCLLSDPFFPEHSIWNLTALYLSLPMC